MAIDAGVVTVIMTLTAPGCGMGPVLVDDVNYRVGGRCLPWKLLRLSLVFDPPGRGDDE